jgi:hypothetical protein
MSTNRLEEKQLSQINETNKIVNEGFIGNALLRVLFGAKIKKLFKKGVKIAKDDPEIQAAFSDLKYHTDRLQNHIDDFCKDHPDDKNC